MADAAKAKAALQSMADSVKAESAAEVAASTKAAQARQADITAIKSEAQSLTALANAAKQTNVQLLYGGRNDMQQHLSDLDRELNYRNLLNRANWLGFSTVQQAMSFRQQMYQQQLLENRAEFAGYLTADQYLGYLTKRTMAASLETSAIKARAMAVSQEAQAFLAYDNAITGTHQSMGQLGEGLSAASSYAAAVTGTPPLVVTRAVFDDSRALEALALYRAALHSIPGMEDTGSLVPVPVPRALSRAASTSATVQILKTFDEDLTQLTASSYRTGSAGAVPVTVQGITGRAASQLAGSEDDALGRALALLAAREAAAPAALGSPDSSADQLGDLAAAVEIQTDAQAAAARSAQIQDELTGVAGQAEIAATQLRDFTKGAASHFALAREDIESIVGDGEAIQGDLTGAGFTTGSGQQSVGSEVVPYTGFPLDKYSAPEEMPTTAVFEDDEAEDELHNWVGDVTKAIRDKYVFAAQFDDTKMMEDLNQDVAKLRAAAAGWEGDMGGLSIAGQGGSSGGGGGGGPPPAAAAGDFEDDADAVRALDTAMRDLRDDESAAGETSHATSQDFLDMAHAATSAGDAAKYMYAAGVAGKVEASDLSDDALANAQAFLDQAAASGKAEDASRGAFAANMALGIAERSAAASADLLGSKTGGASSKLATATLGADAAGIAFLTMKDGLAGASAGWGGLLTKVNLFGGLVPGLMGHVQVFHILLDLLIEFAAVAVPAIVGVLAMAGALGIFALVGQQAGDVFSRIYDRTMAAQQAMAAFNTIIPPARGAFASLVTEIRPEIFTLLGEAIGGVGLETGAFGRVALSTGAYLDHLGAVISLFVRSTSFTQFLHTAVGDMEQFGRMLGYIGSAFVNFFKAAEITHIAEDMLEFFVILAKGLDALSRLPAPLIAAALALHGLWLWGGLASTVLLKLVDPIRSVALSLGALDVASSNLGSLGKDASPFQKLGAAVQDIGAGFMNIPHRLGLTTTAMDDLARSSGVTVDALQATAKYAEDTGVAVASMIPAAVLPKVAALSEGMDDAGVGMLSLAAASKASEGGLAKVAGALGSTSEEAVAAGGDVGLFGTLLSKMGGLFSNVYVDIALVAAALIGIGVILVRTKDSTAAWMDSMQASLAAQSSLTVINSTMQDLARTQEELNLAQSQGLGNATELKQAQVSLTQEFGNELDRTSQVAKMFGTDMPGALNLLNAAQVKTSTLTKGNSKDWAEALIQVQGLVAGYKAMGIGIGEAQNAITTQLVIGSGSALPAMQKMNTAYDQFLQMSTDLQGAFITTGQDILAYATDVKAAGATMSGTNLSSLALQGSAQQMLTDIEKQADAYRAAVSVSGSGPPPGPDPTTLTSTTQYIKDLVQEMIDSGPHTAAFLAQVSAVASEGGYGGATGSLKDLVQWTGNIKDPMDKAQAATNAETIAVSNLGLDAQNLATTMQADLNPALASASFNALGGQAALNRFSTDLAKFGPDSKVTIDAGHEVANMFLSIEKNSATAQALFVGWAESMGMSKAAADKLWQSVSKGSSVAYRMQLTDNISAEQAKIKSLVKELSDTTNPAKRHLLELEIKVDTAKLAGLKGDLKLSEKPLQDLAGQVTDLGKPGLWGQVEHQYLQFGDAIKDWFANSLPHAVLTAGDAIYHFFVHDIPHWAEAGWDTSYHAFFEEFASPLVRWFTDSLPHGIEAGWDKVWSELIGPVIRLFENIKSFISSSFDAWWKGHGKEVEEVWDAVWGVVRQVALYTWDKLVEAAKIFWARLKQIFSGGSSLLTGSVKEAWSQIQAVFKTGVTGVENMARDMWHDIVLVAQGFWGLFGGVIKSGWDIIDGIFRIAITVVEGVAKAFWDGLAMMAKIFWAALQAAVKIAWDVIVAIFSVALDLITGNWSQAWTDIQNLGKQIWNALSGFYTAAWSAFRADWSQMLNLVKSGWDTTWGDIKNVADQVWSALKSGFSSVVSSIKTTWSTLEGIFKGPVSFLVNDVYDDGIAKLWNDVMGVVNGPKLPSIKFAGGGRLAEAGGHLGGYGGGDIVPALLEPGEAVVDKDRTRKYAHVLAAMGVPGFSPGGIIGGIGNFLSGAVHDVEHVLGDAVDVGKIITALATGNTTALGNALDKLVGPGGASGELAGMIIGIPKTLIKDLLSVAGAAGTKAAAAVAGPGGTSTPGLMTVARYIMASGGTKAAGAGVAGVVAGESGGNPEAEEAGGGGGMGLIQWTPGSKARPYQPIITGNAGKDMAVQLPDMLNYIDGRGGIGAINAGGASGGPMGAAEVFSAMEAPLVPGSDIRAGSVAAVYAALGGGTATTATNDIVTATGDQLRAAMGGLVLSMAAGGEVRVPYLQGFTAGEAHNILVAAGLRPQADAGQKASWRVSSSSPHGNDEVPPHYGVWINANATTKETGLKVPDLVGYEAGVAHNILLAEGLIPTAAAGQKSTWQVTGSHPGQDSGIGRGARVEIVAPKPSTPGPKTPGGMDSAQAWSYYSGQLAAVADAQKTAFWALNNAKLPAAATAAQKANWAKDLTAMQSAQTIAGRDRDVVLQRLGSPADMTAAQWGELETALSVVKGLEYGTADPDWNWPGWHYELPLWQKANAATKTMQTDVAAAYAAWQGDYSPGAPGGPPISKYGTPGILVTQPGAPSFGVDLSSLIIGGPAAASYATGGPVGADGASLGDIAGLFAMGGADPGPALAAFGLPSAVKNQLATATAAGMPRSLSDAAGQRIGVQVGNITVNNPVPEKPSDSITRSTNRLAFLAGRQAV